MYLLDVNVLIYAHRADQAKHALFKRRLEVLTQSGENWGTSAAVNAAFLRITTNPKFPNGPTPLAQALAVIDSLVSHPNYIQVDPGVTHWKTLRELCRRTQAVGNQVADAQHAAIAIDSGAIWISADNDFEAFEKLGLRWEYWQ